MTAYRQKLTAAGWVGIILFLGSPVLGGFLTLNAFDALQITGGPRNVFAFASLTGLATMAGAVLILVGRAYVPVAARAAVHHQPLDANSNPSERPGDLAQTYRGQDIRVGITGYRVGAQSFRTIEEAQDHIDGRSG